MRRVWLIGVAALLALGVGLVAALGGGEEERRTASDTPRAPSAMLAVIGGEAEGSRLAWLEPRTLRQLRRRSVPLGGDAWSPVFSPSGGMVALGGRGAEGVRIVDLERMRLIGRAARGVDGRSIQPLAWPERDRLLALDLAYTQGPGVPRMQNLLVVDPVARRLVATRPLRGWATATARAPGSVVLLVEPASGVGPARLAVVGASGRVREVLLSRIRSGVEEEEGRGSEIRFRVQNPGLAVDPDAGRAFVLGAGAPVAEIDLRTLAVSDHELSEPISGLSRLRGWLEPVAQAKSASGWSRQALWLGDGMIAVSGSDYDGLRSTPTGLSLIDVRSWSVRTLEPRAGLVSESHGVLLAAAATRDGRAETEAGIGVAAYARTGERLWHALGDEPVWWTQTAGGYAYVPARGADSGGVRVIDLRTGEVSAAVRSEMPVFLDVSS